jgi:hypothetical protein
VEHADSWLLDELENLAFKPYKSILPKIRTRTQALQKTEKEFLDAAANKLTKRQAVAFGLLARTFQLSISCLSNQLLQNFSGWNCSFRALLETFFVLDWVEQDAQRFESYFEGRGLSIGRIKNESCGRHPELATLYEEASQITHISTRSLHLPRNPSATGKYKLPFTGTSMYIPGHLLTEMLSNFKTLLTMLHRILNRLLVDNFDLLSTGEVLWERHSTKIKFGCLAFQAKDTDASQS